MGLLKRAHVRGLNFGLIRNGLVSYPSSKFANEAADAVADSIPEEAAPEVSGETGMTAAEAAPILQKLQEVAQEIAAKTGSAMDTDLNKIAAHNDLDIVKLAYAHADRCIEKAALESGTMNPGSGPATHEQVFSEGETDAQKNPASAVVGPKGSTSLDTSAGAVGSQTVRPDQPGTQDSPAPTTLADVKISSLLAKLSTDGTLPQSGGRQDLTTNAAMGKNMVVQQGMTHSTTPHVPVPLKKHPAAPQPHVGNELQADVKKAAAQLLSTEEGRQVLAHLHEQQKQASQNAEVDAAAQILLTALQQQAAQ